ncbi:MAG: phytanoyl-CoA dioxygenase family protein [Akkermansiaceae bacterium]|nr:phytanoyl-CoA dioxygenase family protein [Armatimonadota bacterium]
MSNTTIISTEEKAAGYLSDASLHQAVTAVNTDGYVILGNAVDVAHLDILLERTLSDLEQILARKDVPFNFNTGNVQQDPPPFAPYLFDDVLKNEFVIQITRAILGDGVKNIMYSGNTALPGGTRQPVHPDGGQLWSGLTHPTPAYNLVVNVPLVAVSPANGSTEFWPGTHLDTGDFLQKGSLRVSEDDLEKRAAQVPPFQPTIPRGSVVIRDLRMWHAGMPNTTDQPRPMIAMIHSAGWWGSGAFGAPRASAPFFEHPDLRFAVQYTDGASDYITNNQAYDLRK